MSVAHTSDMRRLHMYGSRYTVDDPEESLFLDVELMVLNFPKEVPSVLRAVRGCRSIDETIVVRVCTLWDMTEVNDSSSGI